MKTNYNKQLVAKLNEALWLSLTSESIITENHCDELFLLQNEMTDFDIPFTMDGNNTGKSFTQKDTLLLNELVANIGDIFHIASELSNLVKQEDYETAELYKELLDGAITTNIDFGKKYIKGIQFFYSFESGINLRFTKWYIISNIILHKAGILLDISVSNPDFGE